jgi:hypothetical protein
MPKQRKLYKAHSMVSDPDYGEICYHWYISDRHNDKDLPFQELIEDYHNIECDDLFYIKKLVSEFFNEIELKTLQAFLKYYFNVKLVSEEVSLPINKEDQNVMPYSGIPAGGGPNHYLLHKHSRYNLPFKVVGYYDTRSADLG